MYFYILIEKLNVKKKVLLHNEMVKQFTFLICSSGVFFHKKCNSDAAVRLDIIILALKHFNFVISYIFSCIEGQA